MRLDLERILPHLDELREDLKQIVIIEYARTIDNSSITENKGDGGTTTCDGFDTNGELEQPLQGRNGENDS